MMGFDRADLSARRSKETSYWLSSVGLRVNQQSNEARHFYFAFVHSDSRILLSLVPRSC